MYLFHVFCVILFLTSVLTLTTKQEKKLDPEVKNANNSTSKTVDNVFKSPIKNNSKISRKKSFPKEKIGKLNISNLNQSILEGGGKVNLASLPLKSDLSISQKSLSDFTLNAIKEGIQKEHNVKASDRKEDISTTEQVRMNIKARKGVGNEINSSDADSSLKDDKLKNKVNKASTTKPKISIPKLDSNFNSTSQNVSTVTKAPLKVSTEKVKKHKMKPTVTIGGSNVDEPIPASPTKSPPLGMPRKIDYVVPIMITIFTVPLLSVATYILYRRGKDCWDKRHYRRMDFLIDGMYNE